MFSTYPSYKQFLFTGNNQTTFIGVTKLKKAYFSKIIDPFQIDTFTRCCFYSTWIVFTQYLLLYPDINSSQSITY